MLELLDANSTYIDPEAFHEMLFQKQGKYGGIGVDAVMEGGLVKVVAVVDETPAAQAGLMPNNLITKIDGDEVQAMTNFEAADRMRGAIGAPVTLSIRGQNKSCSKSYAKANEHELSLLGLTIAGARDV